MLNRPAAINDQAIAHLPQLAINTELDIPPTYDEVNKAIKQMATGKAPGPDAIPAEVYKTGGETIRSQLTSMFQSMWYQKHLTCRKNSGMPQPCTSISGREIASPVITTEEYSSCP